MRHFTRFAIALCVGISVVANSQPANLPAYFESQVDVPVSDVKGNVAPAYPTELKARQVTGTVFIQFVVDTLGRPEMGTFKVVRSPEPLFTESSRAAIQRMHFVAAQKNGKKVRQVVQQRYSFSPPS